MSYNPANFPIREDNVLRGSLLITFNNIFDNPSSYFDVVVNSSIRDQQYYDTVGFFSTYLYTGDTVTVTLYGGEASQTLGLRRVDYTTVASDGNDGIYDIYITGVSGTNTITFTAATVNTAYNFEYLLEIDSVVLPTPSVTPTMTVTPTVTPTNTKTPTVTPSMTSTPVLSPTPTNTPTPTSSLTPTVTPTTTITPSPTNTITPTNTVTPTQSITPTSTLTPTMTATPTSSITPTNTPTPTLSVTPTVTPTNTITPTTTITPTSTVTPSITPTNTITPTPSVTPLDCTIQGSAVEQTQIIQNGLVINVNGTPASYPGTGTVWTSIATGTTYNGDLINGPIWNSGTGGYFSFDGVDDYCYFGDSSKGLNTGSRTFGGWVNATTSSTDKVFYIRGEDGFSAGWSISLYKQANTNLFACSAVLSFGSGTSTVTSTTTLVDNTWYYVVARWTSGTGLSIYVNGVKESTVSHSGTTLRTSTKGWQIARYNGPTYREMNIGGFELYDRALSDAEVLQNYNTRKSIYGY